MTRKDSPPLPPPSVIAGRLLRPAQEFISTEVLSGLMLLSAMVVALAWVNSPLGHSYHELWKNELHLDLVLFRLDLDLHQAVNDGLMTIFFFVVGLEIKREVFRGELASRRKAALPVAAALGGMVVPALIYTAWNVGSNGAAGWGIPMATDIAFALGVLALLGARVPFALKVFLLALAIVDDLGAIAVIAVFYTDTISVEPLLYAAALIASVLVLGRAGVRSVNVYVFLGVLLWAAMFKSGIHATLAGVALAAVTPHRAFLSPEGFEARALGFLGPLRDARDRGDEDGMSGVLREYEHLSRESEPPLDRLEHALHPWTGFLIVPVFALANAGISLSGSSLEAARSSPVAYGVAMGLTLGKPAGILLFSWFATKTNVAALPPGVRFVHILGAGILAGIGFTVSLFITELAFTDTAVAAEAKIGILAASVIAGVAGLAFFSVGASERQQDLLGPGDRHTSDRER